MAASNLYSPLDSTRHEIRLLTIKPFTENMQISCTLTKSSLQEKPYFMALSYVWGDPNITEEIFVNDQKFMATTNLVAALRSIREIIHPSKEHVLGRVIDPSTQFWIDAICINQDDFEERSSQVQLMSDLYRSAHCVFGWLGLDTGELGSCLGMFERISSAWEVPGYFLGEVYEYMRSHTVEEVFAGVMDPMLWVGADWRSVHPRWQRILDKFDLDYWKRLWILQEIIMAKRVIFLIGLKYITWDDIKLFWRKLYVADVTIRYPPTIPPMVWSEFCSTLRGHTQNFIYISSFQDGEYKQATRSSDGTMNDIGFKFPDYQCSNPRDKVYGLLGFNPLPIKVDYTAPVRDVYTEYTGFCIDGDTFGDVLAFSGIGLAERNQERFDLPSWVPDFYQSYHRDLSGRGDTHACAHRDVFKMEACMKTHVNGSLRLSGIKCDQIQSIQIPRKNRYDQQFTLSSYIFDTIVNYKTNSEKMFKPGIPALRAILCIFLQDEGPELDLKRAKIDPNSDTTYFMAVLFLGFLARKEFDQTSKALGIDFDKNFIPSLFGTFFPGTEPNASWPLNASPSQIMRSKLSDPKNVHTQEDFQKICKKREESYYRFFHTRSGFLGWGPPGMRNEDQVWVLPNCHWPVLLRDTGSGLVHVGCAFVLGLVEGEVAEMIKTGEVKIEEIEIH